MHYHLILFIINNASITSAELIILVVMNLGFSLKCPSLGMSVMHFSVWFTKVLQRFRVNCTVQHLTMTIIMEKKIHGNRLHRHECIDLMQSGSAGQPQGDTQQPTVAEQVRPDQCGEVGDDVIPTHPLPSPSPSSLPSSPKRLESLAGFLF